MRGIIFSIFLLLSLNLFLFKCEAVTEIPVSSNPMRIEGALKESSHLYKIKLNSVSEYNYLNIRFYFKEETSNLKILVSGSSSPDEANSAYISHENNRPIYIQRAFFKNLKEFYIKIINNAPMSFTFSYNPLNAIEELVLPDYFDMPVNNSTSYQMKYQGDLDTNDGNIMLTLTGSTSKSRTCLKGRINMLKDSMKKTFEMNTLFHNGIGFIISNNVLADYSKNFVFEFSSCDDDVVTIEFRRIENFQMIHLYPNEPISVIFSKEYSKELTFNYYPESSNQTDSFIMIWRSFNNNLLPGIKSLTTKGNPKYHKLTYSEFCNHRYSIQKSNQKAFNIRLKEEFDFGSVQLQLINRNLWTKERPVFSTIDLGIPVSGTVISGRIIHYKVKFFSKGANLDFLMQVFAGEPTLYIGKCAKSFPQCNFHPDDLEELVEKNVIKKVTTKKNVAFGSVSVDGDEDVDVFGFVYCPDKKDIPICYFDMSVKEESTIMQLSRNMRYSKPLRINAEDTYSFRIQDPLVKDIYVVFYRYVGDSITLISTDLNNFNTKIGKEYWVENKKYIHIQGENLVNEYFVKIQSYYGQIPSYYTLYFVTYTTDIKDFQVQPGEITTESITKKENEKIYSLLNPSTVSTIPFIATFTALNCKIKVTFESDEKIAGSAQFIIEKNIDAFVEEKYFFKVKFLSLDTGSSDEEERCVFYIASNDHVHPLTLNEGVVHSMTLTQQINRISYGYDIYYYLGNLITISVTKFDSQPVALKYTIRNPQGSKEKKFYITTSRIFILQTNEIKEGCGKEIHCRIYIEVENKSEKNDNIGTKFEISVNDNLIKLNYLSKGVMRFDGVLGNQVGVTMPIYSEYVYYYSDVGKDSESEVVIDFKRGSGRAVANLVQKGLSKTLPNKKSKNLIPFDYFNKKFVITSKDTKICENGCDLVIGVFTDIQSVYFSLSEYTIFIRDESTVVNLPINEYAYGSLSKTESDGEYNYYTTTIYKETDRVILEFNSDLCAGYVNVNKDELPTKEKHDYFIESKDSLTIIKDSDLKVGGSFLNKHITVAISTKALDGKYNSFYSYRVISPEKKKKTIIDINSAQNAICETENKECYFRIEIHLYNYVNHLYLYAFNEKAIQNDFVIYANMFNFDELYERESVNIDDLVPTEENHDFTSKGLFYTDRLDFPLEKKGSDLYIYIMVKASKDGLVNLLSSFFYSPYLSTLRPNSYQMFLLHEGFYTEYEIIGDNIYYVEVKRLFGDGIVTESDDEKEVLLNGEKTSIATIIKPSDEQTYVKIKGKANFVFYIKYVVRSDQGNFDEISYGRMNTVKYTKEFFPITYFIPIPKEVNEDVIITVQFRDYEYKNETEKNSIEDNTDEFALTGIITNENYIVSRKKDVDDNPVVESQGSVLFNKDLLLGRFSFSKNDIISSRDGFKKYFFLQIKQDIQNNHSFSRITLDIFATQLNSSKLFIPINQYFYPKIFHDSATEIILKKGEKEHTFINVEFSFNPEEFKFAIETDQPLPEQVKNYTEIHSFGKSIFNIELKNQNKAKIVLHPITKNNTENLSNFMIKYNSALAPSRILKIKNSKINSTIDINSHFRGRISPIVFENETVVPGVKYHLRLFEYNKYDLSYLNTLSSIDRPFRSFKGELKEGMVTFSIKDFPKGQYYMNVLGVVKNKGDKEQFLYETIEVKNGDFENLDSINWVLVGLIVLILFIIGCVFVMYREIIKAKSQQKSDNIEYSKFK